MCSQQDDPTQHGDTLRAALDDDLSGAGALRRWVFNEFGITGEGAWTEEFDRLLNVAIYEQRVIALAASATDEPTRATVTSDGDSTHYVAARPAVPAALEPRQNHCPGCDGSHA